MRSFFANPDGPLKMLGIIILAGYIQFLHTVQISSWYFWVIYISPLLTIIKIY